MMHDRLRGKSADTHIPGEEGIWVLIFGDLVVFGLFFVTYCYYRAGAIALYTASQQHLDQWLGLTNTILLLTSSWFLAVAVDRAKRGRRHADRFILGGMMCGICFLGIKFFEYREKILAGMTLNTNEFFTFYYMYTGIHLIHVTVGLGVLTYLFFTSRRNNIGSVEISIMEGGAAFWHLVDILWIFLFALLYVAR
ncbi:MAG: cytochrome c oxidase subunit 3 [Alphaproteobacteria bacterium]|nr:cytochrome c oxidase subunit 3 [Alphaproteobacteria bacterium]